MNLHEALRPVLTLPVMGESLSGHGLNTRAGLLFKTEKGYGWQFVQILRRGFVSMRPLMQIRPRTSKIGNAFLPAQFTYGQDDVFNFQLNNIFFVTFIVLYNHPVFMFSIYVCIYDPPTC